MHAVVGAAISAARGSSSNSRCVERRSRLGSADSASRISVNASTKRPASASG